MGKSKTIDMFEENEKHELRIKQMPVKFKNGEIDASKVDFSSKKVLSFAAKSFRQMVTL